MKTFIWYILISTMLLLQFSCAKPEPCKNEDRFIVLNESPDNSYTEWLSKGTNAYGLVVYSKDGKPQFGKPVSCEILDITVRGVKCKALEKVSLFDQFNCYKIGVEKDEIWFDVPEDLFKTEKEARDFLRSKNILLDL